MPYKSDAQRRFFHTDTAKKAGITDKEVNEFDQASKGMKLPEKKMAFGGETNPKKETVKSMENNPTAGFADGGEIPPTLGSENPILSKLRDLLMLKDSVLTRDRVENKNAANVEPIVSSSTSTP